MEEPKSDSELAAYLEAEGVPAMTDPFITKYLSGRDALIDQEKKQRSDRLFRANLSPTAAEACALVDQIRFEEQQTLWTPEFEESLSRDAAQDVYPGMMFSLAKARMERGKLWQIVRRMPKGALLHCHLQAMFDIDRLLDDCFATEGMYLSAPEALSSAKSKENAVVEIMYEKAPTLASTSIWSGEYEAGSHVPLAEAADCFPNGGRDGFVTWFRSRCVITAEESVKHHYGLNDIWRRFTAMFRVVGAVISYEPLYRKALRRMLEQLADDGIRWVEARSTFIQPFKREGQAEFDEGHEGFFDIFQEEVEKFQATEAGKGFWGARIIWTALRIFPMEHTVESMKECIAMKQQFPDLISGFDLVGQEDLGRPLTDFVPVLFWFRKRCAESGVDLPFFFHAGETLGDGSAADENLADAVLLGTRRIGHGFSLYKHPLLLDMVKDRRILVESCPVSNEVLRLCASVLSHPLPALLARGVPVALCNDDPAMLGHGTASMSYDCWQALQGWDNLGLAGLGSLAENSVRWAAFEDCTAKEWSQGIKDGAFGSGVRAGRLREWMAEWERFCAWVVDEFGSDENVEPEE